MFFTFCANIVKNFQNLAGKYIVKYFAADSIVYKSIS